MTEGALREIADAAARRAGHDLDRYEEPAVRRTERGWQFLYVLKPPTPAGGHFTVVVDELGTARVIEGW